MHLKFTFIFLHFDTEDIQAKIDIFEVKQGTETCFSHNPVNETKWKAIESKIIDVETKYGTDLFAFSNNLTRLEGDSPTHQSIIDDHNARLTHIELSQTECTCNETMHLQDHDTMIKQLGADNADNGDAIEHLGAKTAHLETVMAECQDHMHIMNSTMNELSRGINANEGRITMKHMQIEQLKLERTLDRVVMQNLNETIAQLEFDSILDQAVIHNINESVDNLEVEGKTFKADIETLNISINALEINSAKHQTDFQNLFANISMLETLRSFDRTFIDMLNSSATQL